MNDRFDDLMYQAGLTAQGCWDSMDSYNQEAVMKFAKLIVKECAELVEDFIYEQEVALDDYQEVTGKEMLLSAFGVEL